VHWNGNAYEAMRVLAADGGEAVRTTVFRAATLDELFRLVVAKHGFKHLVEFSPSLRP